MSGLLIKALGSAAKTIGTDMYTNGMNALGSYLGGLVNEHFADRAREKNFQTNERAAENADKRQRAQYQDLYSPQALMNQYQAAGLSPSIMMSGGAPVVGQSSAQGNMSAGGAGGYPAPSNGNSLMYAQLENIKANTEKTKAETLNIGADTEYTLTNIIKASEETENIKQTRKLLQMQSTGQQLQNEAQKLQNEITSENKDEIIKQCQILSEKLQRESNNVYKVNEGLDLKNQLSQDTYATRVAQFTAEYNQTIMATAKAASDIELNEQQIETLAKNIAIAEFNSRTERLSANAQAKMYQDTIDQWAKQNGFTEEMIKNEKWNIATKTITNIIDSGCKVASAVLSK